MLNIDYPLHHDSKRINHLHWLSHNIPLSNTQLDIPNINGTTPLLYHQPTRVYPGDVAHQYMFLLYHQPENFIFNSSYTDRNFTTGVKRLGRHLGHPIKEDANPEGFDLTRFQYENNIDGLPMATSYFSMFELAPRELKDWQMLAIRKVLGNGNLSQEEIERKQRELGFW